jgi:uncharacterized protein (TIGR00290 family)
MLGGREKVVVCWSGGKDSAMALHEIAQDCRYDVISLITTCSEEFGRVCAHGVRVELAAQQADSIGLPLETVYVKTHASNDEYRKAMAQCLLAQAARGVTAVVFGDIFLEDLRAWREAELAQIGLRAIFPLWRRDTRRLIAEFIERGFESVICCVSDACLDERALGRTIDWSFVNALPANVDPCGENGEFHTFAFNGPIFKEPIPYDVGRTVYRPIEYGSQEVTGPKGFWFCDLVPVTVTWAQ